MQEMPKLIAATGKSQSGKDTIAQILAEMYGYKRVSFADPVKTLAYKIGWDGNKKNPKGRSLLQRLGMGVREVIGEGTWVDLAMARVDGLLSQNLKVVITDLRMPNEVVAVKKRGGKILRVICNVRGLQGAVSQDVSETSMDLIQKPDYTITNDEGMEELIEKVKEAVWKL